MKTKSTAILGAVPISFLVVVTIGCYPAPQERTVAEFPAGVGKIRVDQKAHVGGEIFNARAIATAQLVYVDQNGYEKSFLYVTSPYYGWQRSKDAAVSLRDDDRPPNWLSPLLERETGQHIYLDPDRFTEAEFTVIADCIKNNLDAIEEAYTQEMKLGRYEGEPNSPNFVSVRRYAYGSRDYTHRANDQIRLAVQTNGEIVLNVPRTGGHSGRSTMTLGIVKHDAHSVLLANSEDLPEHPQYIPFVADAIDGLVLTGFYGECRDEKRETIADHFRVEFVAAADTLHHIALAKMDSDGGIPRFIKALANENERQRAAWLLRDAGPLATAATAALFDSAEQGNMDAADALVTIGGDRSRIVSIVIADVAQNGLRDRSARVLKKLKPESEAAIPMLVEKLRSVKKEESYFKDIAFTLFDLGGNRPEIDQAMIDQLHSPNKSIRRTAASLLGYHEKRVEAAIPALTATLNDEDGEVRMAAADTLLTMGEPASRLMPILIDELGTNARGQERAISILRKIGVEAKAAIPMLQQLGEAATTTTVRESAKRAIQEISAAEAEAKD